MLIDFREGVKLLEKYPDRFRFVYYEDLNDDPFEKLLMLYKYLGMSLDPAYYTELSKQSIFTVDKQNTERKKNTAFWWRTSLSWKQVQNFDNICGDTIDELGYKRFDNEDIYRNLSWPSLEIPRQFLLV